jgi:hypothetical protein
MKEYIPEIDGMLQPAPSMRRGLGLLGVLAGLAMMGTSSINGGIHSSQITSHMPEKPIPNGHKPFNIDGVIIYALNEKNARKKANKRK